MKINKSTPFNIDANIIVLISYIGGLILMWIPTLCYFAWVIPLIAYLTEEKNKYIKEETSKALFIYLLTSILSIVAFILLLFFSPIDYSHIYNILASGSLIILLLISLFVSIVKIIVSFFICIATIKSWNYETYKIPYIETYLKTFRKYLTKLDKLIYKNNTYSTNHPKSSSKESKTTIKKIKGQKINKGSN